MGLKLPDSATANAHANLIFVLFMIPGFTGMLYMVNEIRIDGAASRAKNEQILVSHDKRIVNNTALIAENRRTMISHISNFQRHKPPFREPSQDVNRPNEAVTQDRRQPGIRLRDKIEKQE